MPEAISIEEAINVGRKNINRPISIIQISVITISAYLFYKFRLPGWSYVLILPIAVVVPWIYWSFMITKWRIWAFENVLDIHELKRRAIKEKLIWPDGSIFEKTEIRTSRDKERLGQIEEKLKK